MSYISNIYEMDRYTRTYDLILNRVGVINEVLGCRYHHGRENPCRVEHERGSWSVTLCGGTLCSWDGWDVDGALSALDCVSSAFHAVWHLRRGKFVRKVTDIQPA